MRERIKVDQEKIKEMLLSGLKPYTVANKLKIPRSVVDRIYLGKDVPYYKLKPIRDKSKLCQKCGCNPKADGFRFLCLKCFHGSDSTDEYRVAI